MSGRGCHCVIFLSSSDSDIPEEKNKVGPALDYSSSTLGVCYGDVGPEAVSLQQPAKLKTLPLLQPSLVLLTPHYLYACEKPQSVLLLNYMSH